MNCTEYGLLACKMTKLRQDEPVRLSNQNASMDAPTVPTRCCLFCVCLRCAASRGSRKTLGNFVKATFYALSHTYGFLSPDLWAETKYTKSPLQEFTDFLAKPAVAAAPKVDYEAAY